MNKKPYFPTIAKTLLAITIFTTPTVSLAEGTKSSSSEVYNDNKQTEVSIRTETYPRPPYSGVEYYYYEIDNKVIYTKLEVCNKYGSCNIVYKKGFYKNQEDADTGAPYDSTPPVSIPVDKLNKHVCLKKFGLL